jgi:hypothetical protein
MGTPSAGRGRFTARREIAMTIGSIRALGPLCVGIAALGLATAARSVPAEKPDVRARLLVPASASAGTRVTVTVELTLGPNWHVNSHTPSEPFLVPTDVSLSTTSGDVSEVRYPQHVERSFPFSDKPLRVYEGTVRFDADLSLPDSAAGSARVSGVVSYQACNDRQCFAPAKLPLEASMTISKR